MKYFKFIPQICLRKALNSKLHVDLSTLREYHFQLIFLYSLRKLYRLIECLIDGE